MTKDEVRTAILMNYPSVIDGTKYIQVIKQNQSFLNSTIIGLYYPLKSEINLLKLMNFFKDKIFVFPKIENNMLKFCRVSSLDDFNPGIFHTMEPNNSCECIPNDAIDLLFVPCLGVSCTLQRLGWGKGYYDEFILSNPNTHFKTVACLPMDRINLDIKMRKEDMTIDEIITLEK